MYHVDGSGIHEILMLCYLVNWSFSIHFQWDEIGAFVGNLSLMLSDELPQQ